MSDYIIKVENLGKKYRIRHQAEQQHYVALRDVIANGVKDVGSKVLETGRHLFSRNGVSHTQDLAPHASRLTRLQAPRSLLHAPCYPMNDELIIEPGSGFKHYWRDIWRYRELFYVLAWRDIAVRYKQTVIGIVWALIRPLVTMIVFTIVFNKVAKLQAPGSVPYPLLVFAAMLPWQFFSTALSESSGSLVSNANLISKVYFPRLIVPAGSVITSFVDFLITLGLMAAMMLWYGFLPDWRVLTLPLFVALAFGAAFGAGLWLCALNVKYRDFRYVIPFVVQFGLYVSPVGFTSDNIPENWRLLYSLNPMVGVIDGFRWALLRGETPLESSALLASLLITSVLCLFGIWYFRKMEDSFADVI